MPIVQAKTKPEPWLHIAVMFDRNVDKQTNEWIVNIFWALYIWDTRQVEESGSITMPDDMQISKQEFKLTMPARNSSRIRKALHATPAKDNQEPLIGKGKEIEEINRIMTWKIN